MAEDKRTSSLPSRRFGGRTRLRDAAQIIDPALQRQAAMTRSVALKDQAATPPTRLGEYGQVYSKSADNSPYFLTSAGAEQALCRIKLGTYTGDGSTGQAITGVGFQPKIVRIVDRLTSETSRGIYEKWEENWGDYALRIVGGTLESLDNRINSLDADGFTVDDDGSDQNPNKSAVVYSFIALG